MYKSIKQIRKERLKLFNGKNNPLLKKTKRKQMFIGFSFLWPAIIITTIFTLAAACIGFWLTFREGGIITNRPATHSAWKKVFTSYKFYIPHLERAFRNTLIFTSASSGITLIISLFLTTILNDKTIKGKNVFLTIYFLPQVTSAIASAIIFLSIFGPKGVIKMDYIKFPIRALWIIIVNSIWGGVAGTIIIYNTAFTQIDSAQYESASIDGAGGIRKFFKITLPNLSNILLFSLLTSFIGGLAVFDAPYAVTQASEALKANPYLETVAFFGYKYLIGLNGTPTNVGIGMVILFILAIVILILTFIVNKIKPIE